MNCSPAGTIHHMQHDHQQPPQAVNGKLTCFCKSSKCSLYTAVDKCVFDSKTSYYCYTLGERVGGTEHHIYKLRPKMIIWRVCGPPCTLQGKHCRKADAQQRLHDLLVWKGKRMGMLTFCAECSAAAAPVFWPLLAPCASTCMS